MTRGEEIIIQSYDYGKYLLDTGFSTEEAALKCMRVAFIDGARWADEHPHWISVEDCLPKIEEANCEWVGSEDVLALLWNGDMSVGRYERDNSTGEHYWVLYGVDKDLVVTHWMPLPSTEGIRGNQGGTSPNQEGGNDE